MFKMKTLVLSMFAHPYPQTEPCQAVLTSFAAPCSSLSTFFSLLSVSTFSEGDSKISPELQAKVNAIRCFSFSPPLFLLVFSCGPNHPLSLRSQAEANAVWKGLPANSVSL